MQGIDIKKVLSPHREVLCGFRTDFVRLYFLDHELKAHLEEYLKLGQLNGSSEDLPRAMEDAFDCTPLHNAAIDGDFNKIRTILEKGSGHNDTDLAGRSPLHIAIQTCEEEKLEATIRVLLERGADTEVRSKDGVGPLHSAASRNDKTTEILLQAGANANIQDRSRQTPLHWAAFSGCENAVDVLLAKGSYRDARDDYGRTPLHLAAVGGRKSTAERLVSKSIAGIKSLKDRHGRTLLHLAVRQGHEEIIEVLLEVAHEETNAEDNMLFTPCELGILYGREKATVSLLRTCEKIRIEWFYLAVAFGRKDIIKTMIPELERDDIERSSRRVEDI